MRSRGDAPSTLTGKVPSPAALEREREYLEWLNTQPDPVGDEPSADWSWKAFMAVRRKQRERQRLRQVEARRKESRREARLEQDERYACLRQQLQGYFGAMAPEPRGRPIDPNSKRQQLLAARAQRDEQAESQREAQRKAQRKMQRKAQRKAQRVAAKKAEQQRLLAAQLAEHNELQLELRKQQDARLNELLAIEHGLPNDFVWELTRGQRCGGHAQPSARELCATKGWHLDLLLTADTKPERAQLLFDLLEVATSSLGAYSLAQFVKRSEIPDALLSRVKTGLVIEYLKPEMQRSWNIGMRGARASK